MGLEISQKVKQVFPPFGGEGGVQSNWHYSGGVQNSLMKRLANFEIAKSKTLGVMAQTKNFDSLLKEKKKKNDTSKIDSIGFKTDTAEIFFEKFALFLLVTQNQ